MFKAINGWTKSKMLKVLKARRYNAAAVIGATCAYTTPNGNRCAVGMFIPKGHKGASLKGGVGTLLEDYPDLEKVMPLEIDALEVLQGVHDACAPKGTSKNKNAKQAMIDWVKKNVA